MCDNRRWLSAPGGSRPHPLPVCLTEWHQGKVTAEALPHQATKTPAKMQRESFRGFFFLLFYDQLMCAVF